MHRYCWLGLLLMLVAGSLRAAMVSPRPGELLLATDAGLIRLNHGGAQAHGPLPPDLQTPLGSTWKLFVYLYLADRDLTPPDYRCQGQLADEVFCCRPGESVGMDRALAQSCGLYFEPRRLGIDAARWRRYWRRQAPGQDWLAALERLGPDTPVPVASLMAALAEAPAGAAQRARQALLEVTLDGRGAGAVRYFGSGLRVKTWTWDRTGHPGEKMGGVLGWLADGSVVWAASIGPSTQLFTDWSALLGPLLLRPSHDELAASCVQVRLFARYPLLGISDEQGRPPPPGPLQGRYHLRFARGTALDISSQGELELLEQGGRPQLLGHFDLDDYVARVLDREGAAQPLEAARALAVVARTYVLQNAAHAGGCYLIDDSSSLQRVAARPPTAAAVAVARWSEGLIIVGAAVRYHGELAAPGVLSWAGAQQQAAAGRHFDEILAETFAGSHLASLYLPDDTACAPLPAAEDWLRAQIPGWSRQLAGEDGFEAPPLPVVCYEPWGRPQVDVPRRRIFVHGLRDQEDRISLTHEWLHLAFAFHPRGRDEFYIEDMARRLNGL